MQLDENLDVSGSVLSAGAELSVADIGPSAGVSYGNFNLNEDGLQTSRLEGSASITGGKSGEGSVDGKGV